MKCECGYSECIFPNCSEGRRGKMPLMKCGCVAQGLNALNQPVCIVHIGLDPRATEVDEAPPSLEGRESQCPYCKNKKPSSFDLPFFTRGDKIDSHYDGCRGWD